MENLTSAVGVSTQDEAGLKPLQQLRRERESTTSKPQRPVAARLHHQFHHHHRRRLPPLCRSVSDSRLYINWMRALQRKDREREGGREKWQQRRCDETAECSPSVRPP